MGGTQFNGRALVSELVRAGHDVTVCNRARTPTELPAGVRRLTADRTDHQSLRDALGGTDWDCVHDLTAYHPPDVETMLELLDGRTGHYVFASSTVIYAASDVLPVGDEPRHDLASMFEHTFDWYQRSGRAEADATRYDWSFEDALLQELS